MKTIITLLFICLMCLSGRAQDWVHQGSTWHYTSYIGFSGGYTEYHYSGDTIVDNHNCHQILSIRYTKYSYFPIDTQVTPPIFTYASADTVFFYYNNWSKWEPVYFFGAHPGDSLTIPNPPGNTHPDSFAHIIIDSVGIMLIDTNHLRYYVFHLTDSCAVNNSFGGKVIERLGMFDNNLMPFWHCITDDNYYFFRCYQDDSFPLYSIGANCNYIYTGINDPAPNSFSIYPNPAQDEITIRLDKLSKDMTISISDISGIVLLHQALETTDDKISTGTLADGIYLLTISESCKQRSAKKIVISR